MHILVAGAFALGLLPLIAGFLWWLARHAWVAVASTSTDPTAAVRRDPSRAGAAPLPHPDSP